VYKVLLGPHSVPAGKPVHAKLSGSFSPFVAAELIVVKALPVGPTMMVVGLILSEKSPIPSLKVAAGVTKPSVLLTVMLCVPKGVEEDVLTVIATLFDAPGRIGTEVASKAQEAPVGKPLHFRDENVPE
jgi:hypothetical protein